MYDPHSRESRGFAFVTMETGEEADAAIKALNATEQFGKVITVEKVCCIPCVSMCSVFHALPPFTLGPPRQSENPDPWEILRSAEAS
jgi:transformer-2 protein